MGDEPAPSRFQFTAGLSSVLALGMLITFFQAAKSPPVSPAKGRGTKIGSRLLEIGWGQNVLHYGDGGCPGKRFSTLDSQDVHDCMNLCHVDPTHSARCACFRRLRKGQCELYAAKVAGSGSSGHAVTQAAAKAHGPKGYVPAYPCNVLPNATFPNWGNPMRSRASLKNKNWVCKQIPNPRRNDVVWFSPRRNKNEERALPKWFNIGTHVVCWDTTQPVDNGGGQYCGHDMTVACPSTNWYVRAGIGNRLYMLSAAIALAIEQKIPFTTNTPLLEAGGPLPTDPEDPFLKMAWDKLTLGTNACLIKKCKTPNGGEWGDQFTQGPKVTRALAAHRDIICDMTAAPAYLHPQLGPAYGDMVFHFRGEGGTLGFGSFPFVKAAVADARAFFRGTRFVAIAPRSEKTLCHANFQRVMAENKGQLRDAPTGEKGGMPDMQFFAMVSAAVA